MRAERLHGEHDSPVARRWKLNDFLETRLEHAAEKGLRFELKIERHNDCPSIARAIGYLLRLEKHPGERADVLRRRAQPRVRREAVDERGDHPPAVVRAVLRAGQAAQEGKTAPKALPPKVSRIEALRGAAVCVCVQGGQELDEETVGRVAVVKPGEVDLQEGAALANEMGSFVAKAGNVL